MSLQVTHRPIRYLYVVAIAASLAVTGCLPGINLVSEDEEWELGRQIERDINQQVTLVTDAAILNYVRDMGQRVVRNTPMADRQWRFHVVRDQTINAFNAPGGLVYVHSGLIAEAGSASELAGVIAHEIGHGVARHGTQRLSQAYGLSVIAGIVLGQDPGLVQQIAAQIVAGGTIAAFSREMEREADHLGIRYMAAAGYDPEGMARMFERLIEQRQRQPGAVERFFSTHPLTEDRIREVRRAARDIPREGLITNDGQFNSVRSRARQQ